MIRLHLLALGSLLLAGCSTFKPVVYEVRHFVLTPGAAQAAPAVQLAQPVGLGPVTLPGYLLQDQLAVRLGDNEIHYQQNLEWAERLDKNIHRVLGASLGQMLGATNVYFSGWSRAEVGAEIYVSFNRFELDHEGTATLDARWLIVAPEPGAAPRVGESRITRPGSAVAADPDQAVGNLSAALHDLSTEIAAALAETTSNP